MRAPRWVRCLRIFAGGVTCAAALVACGTSDVSALVGSDAGAAFAADGGLFDGGRVATDGGVLTLDAGVVTRDGGGATADGGGAIVDAGVVPRDAGVVTPDAGAPPTDGGLTLAQRCFSALLRDGGVVGPNYDQFSPIIGSHCYGTNHQDITGVERVVFLGDSVTVGTPPTLAGDTYRARLAARLATRFNLRPPDFFWQSANVATGEALSRFSGDFASCAKWGARTDDLLRDHAQIADCFPMAERNKKTLVVLTIGGNDLAALQKDGAHAPYEDSRAQTEAFVALLRDAVRWLKDPANVPGGTYVVFGNMYEYTDATGDIASCFAAQWTGFTDPWDRPLDLERLVIWANEQFLSIAVETRSDMVLMLEHFCGHGFHNNDPQSRCYRGPNTERWFDLTCIHPNPTGHDRLAEMFLSVVSE